MTNEQMISQYNLGKCNIDISNLSNEDKIRFIRIENLLKDLIKFYDKTNKLMINFNNGFRGKDD